MTAVVDSGLFESTMSLPLHNHFRLYIGGDFFVYRRHYCWPVSFRNDCLRDRCYCGRTGWLQQSYPERLTLLSLICKSPLDWLYFCDLCETSTSTMETKNMKKTYNKLVRDKIPEIIGKDHQSCDIEILSDDAYLTMLDAKLDEELAEYHADNQSRWSM